MAEESITTSRKSRIVFGTTVGLSAEALLKGQLAWFRKQGWDVTLVSSPDAAAKRAVDREQVSFAEIPMKRNISLFHDLRAALGWARLIRHVRPEVVNLGTPKASLLGNLAAWIGRVPRRIYTVRGLRLEGASGLMAKLLWMMERATIAMATDVIVVSPSLGEELVKRKLVSAQDIWIVGSGSSNGVDAAAIEKRVSQVDNRSLRKQLGIKPASFVVGYIGRVGRAKGIDTLLSAIRSEQIVGNVELLVVGSIEDIALGRLIEKMGSCVHSVPWTDDVWGYLPAMDVLCLPTLREGFPNTVLEAAAAGIPAITTRATGAVDSVIDFETGLLVDVGDVDELADRINLLSSDQVLHSRLGSNAKRRVKKLFKPYDIWSGIEAVAEGRADLDHLKRLNQYLESREPQ